MYHKILIPLDGSDLAEEALKHAQEPATKLENEIILVHVCSPDECHCEVNKCYVQPMHRVYIEHTAYMFRDTLERLGARKTKVNWETLVGDPATEIIRYSKENDVGLILMATHGGSGMKHWDLGSITNKVLRKSDVPIQLVRVFPPTEKARSSWPNRKILALLDGSELAEKILPYVSQQAEMSGVEVVLLRVCKPPDVETLISSDLMPKNYSHTSPVKWTEYIEQQTAKYKKMAKKYLTRIEKQLKKKGCKVKSEVLVGEPVDQIISYVSENPFNFIIMSTHGHSGQTWWDFGSVADKVLHATSNPILLIRSHKD
jgi:nucleotide-binding universal stress UspA family protein